jgi:PAS domain S-box-containing protein
MTRARPTAVTEPVRCPDSEELLRLRLAVGASGEIVFMTGTDGVFTYVNPEFTRVYGYEPSEVVGRATPRLLKSGTMPRAEYETFWRLLTAGQVVRREFVNKTKDGTLLHVQGSANPIVDDSGAFLGFLGIQRDVTESRRIETALAESMRQYQVLANAAEDMIFIVNRAGRIEYANAAAGVKFGILPEAMIGNTLGDTFPPGIAAEMWRALSAVFDTGTRQLFENRFESPAGDLWLETSVVPIEKNGTCRAVLGIARDVTERKLLEHQFMQAQKMEAVGRLAGGIAHDFNNVLTAILGYADLVQGQLRDAPELFADIEEIKKAGERAGRLTRHLLAFTRKQAMQPQLVDVSAVIGDAEKMIRHMLGEDIQLSVSLENTWRIVADPGHIEQVLLNLVVNARDAMPKGGALGVTAANVELDHASARRFPDGQAGRYVRVVVQDTGCGMTAEVLAHVFEPFFTTKPSGKGTGLGLATVYGVVKQSGGWISIDSAPGRGTAVSIFWPMNDATDPPAPDRGNRAEPVQPGSGTILLVEDEPGIRSLMRRTLESRGYRVIQAADGAAGLAAADAHHGSIDMLLTDIVMPLMSGPDLAQRLIRHRPGIKILYVSGYPHNFSASQHPGSGRLWFLAKPFTPLALAQTVQQCLSANRDVPG